MKSIEKRKFWKQINENYFPLDNSNNVYHFVEISSQFNHKKEENFKKISKNAKNLEIFEEIENLEKEIKKLEHQNMEKLEFLSNQLESDRPILSKEDNDIRNENLINQIYSLQMEQFSESIYNVKLENNKTYCIEFDPNESLNSIKMNRNEYLNLKKYRDPANSVCLYDIFLEKIHSYYNSTPTKTIPDNNNIENNQQKDFSQFNYQIPKRINIHYGYCHHCKQRKPLEIMLQCKARFNRDFKYNFNYKCYNINGITIFSQSKCLVIIFLT